MTDRIEECRFPSETLRLVKDDNKTDGWTGRQAGGQMTRGWLTESITGMEVADICMSTIEPRPPVTVSPQLLLIVFVHPWQQWHSSSIPESVHRGCISLWFRVIIWHPTSHRFILSYSDLIQREEYVSVNEPTPPSHPHNHLFDNSGWGVEVTVTYHCRLWMNPNPNMALAFRSTFCSRVYICLLFVLQNATNMQFCHFTGFCSK